MGVTETENSWERIRQGVGETERLIGQRQYNLAMVKARSTLEFMVKCLADRASIVESDLNETIDALYDGGWINKGTYEHYHTIRTIGNKAVHEGYDNAYDANQAYHMLSQEVYLFSNSQSGRRSAPAKRSTSDGVVTAGVHGNSLARNGASPRATSRGTSSRTAGDQTTGDRTSGNRTTGDRTSGNRTTGDRTSGNRTSGDRTTGDRTVNDRTATGNRNSTGERIGSAGNRPVAAGRSTAAGRTAADTKTAGKTPAAGSRTASGARVTARSSSSSTRSRRQQRRRRSFNPYDLLKLLIPLLCVILLIVIVRLFLPSRDTTPETTAPETTAETMAESAPPETVPETMTPEPEALASQYTTTTTLNVRSGPSTNDRVLAQLGPNTTVEVLQMYNDEWAVIRYDDQEAYVASRYLSAAETPAESGASEEAPQETTAQ